MSDDMSNPSAAPPPRSRSAARTILLAVGVAGLLALGLIGALVPLGPTREACGTAFFPDDSQIREQREQLNDGPDEDLLIDGDGAFGRESRRIYEDLQEAHRRLERATDDLEEACKEERSQALVRLAIFAVLPVALLVAALSLKDRAA